MEDFTEEIDHYLSRLFPLTRSLTGEGNRETLKILQEIIPLDIKEYPSGQRVYDWIIPKEWNIRDAWIKNSQGVKIIDFQKSNIHVVNYSIPIHKKISFDILKEHLYFRKDLPEAIPYRTAYYKRDWGFCMAYNDFKELFNGDDYFVHIDSSIQDGVLNLGEFLIKGEIDKEYLISTYICHPSLANDNLSGLILTAFLAREIMKNDNNFSYRIIFVPETIGAIAYCAENEQYIKEVDCGFVVTTVGGPGKFGYKQSFNKTHKINRVIEKVFCDNKINFIIHPFDVHGSDERQYSSPGFRINMATITKDKYYEYDYYHTSLDDLNFVKAEYVNSSLNLYLQTIEILDNDCIYKRVNPYCELMLSRHGLYPDKGGTILPGVNTTDELDIVLNLLFYADGNTSLFEISEITGLPFRLLLKIAQKLQQKQLIEKILI